MLISISKYQSISINTIVSVEILQEFVKCTIKKNELNLSDWNHPSFLAISSKKDRKPTGTFAVKIKTTEDSGGYGFFIKTCSLEDAENIYSLLKEITWFKTEAIQNKLAKKLEHFVNKAGQDMEDFKDGSN